MKIRNAPAFAPVSKRTYCRNFFNRRETWEEVCKRAAEGIVKLSGGELKDCENDLEQYFYNCEVFPAGRWLWVGGTDWVMKPENHMAGFNCISLDLKTFDEIAYSFDLLCQGCGVGQVLTDENVSKLPPIQTKLVIMSLNEDFGTSPSIDRTLLESNDGIYKLTLGDSRQGWARGIYELLNIASTHGHCDYVTVMIDYSRVRKAGERIKGFGGVTNPTRLQTLYHRIADILNGAVGRRLTAEEVTLIIDEGAETVVAGNVRRSAGMKQFDSYAPDLKKNLYYQDDEGYFRVDEKRQPLRMSNHTKVWHELPPLNKVKESVRQQYETGEGAIQYAPVSVARANRDLLDYNKRCIYLGMNETSHDQATQFLLNVLRESGCSEYEINHRLKRYGLNPCGEIIGKDFACNLSEVQLNSVDPNDRDELANRFYTAGLIASAMLELDFPNPNLEASRQLDPIVGVGLTGWFDYCVKKYGENWLQWCFEGRPRSAQGLHFLQLEALDLGFFNQVVNQAVTDYCESRGIKRPNRTTTIKPSGTLSLLSNACSGGHASKASYMIRRITFSATDPVARACCRKGYNVIPSQRCRDENGQLLDDPFDPRVDEWLVEIPLKSEWVDYVQGEYDTQELPAIAQFDIAMQLQKYYAEHNVSYTIELDEHEIEPLAEHIHDEMVEGNYSSLAIMQRARAGDLKHTFPRLPIEPIPESKFNELVSNITAADFDALVDEEYAKVNDKDKSDTGDLGCSSGVCEV